MAWYNSQYAHDPVSLDDGPYVLQAAQLIQGSPHAANRWQANLHTQITKTGYIRNNIDQSFYTKHNNNNELIAMLSITVDDLLLFYKTESIKCEFYDNLSAAFDVTTPDSITKLKFISLTIYQSSSGTSIDQTLHIQSKILSTWFDHGKHPTKHIDFPFLIDAKHKQDLTQSPSLQGDELQ